MYKKRIYKIIISMIMALPLPLMCVEKPSSDNEKIIVQQEVQDSLPYVSTTTSIENEQEAVSDAEAETALEAFLHKLQSNLILYSIKIRNNWDPTKAALGGLSFTTMLFFSLYMRSRGSAKHVAQLQRDLAGKRALEQIVVDKEVAIKGLQDDLKEKGESLGARLKELHTLQESSGLQSIEQQGKITRLEREVEELGKELASAQQKANTRLQTLIQEVSKRLGKLKDIPIPRSAEDDPCKSNEEVQKEIAALEALLKEYSESPKKGIWERWFGR